MAFSYDVGIDDMGTFWAEREGEDTPPTLDCRHGGINRFTRFLVRSHVLERSEGYSTEPGTDVSSLLHG